MSSAPLTAKAAEDSQQAQPLCEHAELAAPRPPPLPHEEGPLTPVHSLAAHLALRLLAAAQPPAVPAGHPPTARPPADNATAALYQQLRQLAAQPPPTAARPLPHSAAAMPSKPLPEPPPPALPASRASAAECSGGCGQQLPSIACGWVPCPSNDHSSPPVLAGHAGSAFVSWQAADASGGSSRKRQLSGHPEAAGRSCSPPPKRQQPVVQATVAGSAAPPLRSTGPAPAQCHESPQHPFVTPRQGQEHRLAALLRAASADEACLPPPPADWPPELQEAFRAYELLYAAQHSGGAAQHDGRSAHSVGAALPAPLFLRILRHVVRVQREADLVRDRP